MSLKKIYLSILAPYGESSFVLRQKALVLIWMHFILIPVMAAILVMNLFRTAPGIGLIIAIDAVLIAALLCGLALIRGGRYHAAVNLIAAVCTVLAVAGFLARLDVQARTGFNPYSFLMMGIIMYTAFFARKRVHLSISIVLFLFTASAYGYFLAVSPPQMQYIIVTVLVNILLSFVIVIGLSWMNARITDRALAVTQEELVINRMLARNLEEKVEERTREMLEFAGRLFSQEEQYRELVGNIEDIIYVCDWQGNFTYVSPSGLRKFGYEEAEIYGMNYADIIPPEYREQESLFYSNQLKKKIGETFHELPIMAKDGRVFWMEQLVKLTEKRSGEMEFRAIARNITERKKALEALRESEERYRGLIESATDAIFLVDSDGKYLYMNAIGLRVTGYAMDELREMRFEDLVHPDYRAEVAKILEEQMSGASARSYYECPILTRDGGVIWVGQYINRSTDHEGNRCVQCISRDITARRRMEEALRESEERYRRIMDNITDMIFTCDFHGKILYINPAGALKLGYPVEDVVGMNYLHFLLPEWRDRELELYREQVRENIVETNHDYPVKSREGQVRWFSHVVRMTRTPEGEIQFYGVARDITEKKHAEDARREMETQKSRFFDNVSHEIRTPLTLMLSPVESYLQGDYTAEVGRAFFENLYRNGLRLLKLVNNMLDYSRIEAGAMRMSVREIDILRLAEKYAAAIAHAAESRGIALVFDPPSAPVRDLWADTDMMDRILMNLLANALKFTGRGGTVTVRVRDDGPRCRIVIEDTGVGIPADSLGVIFERFGQADDSSTRKFEGTGIGLSLARELAVMHGGTITVESVSAADDPETHGSVFTVELPKGKAHFVNRSDVRVLTDDDGPGAEPRGFTGLREMEDLVVDEVRVPAAPEKPMGGDMKARILFADDNPDMRSFVRALLEGLYDVTTAADGVEALEAIRKAVPDLIITDVMMPMMDGGELVSRIRKDPLTSRVPVIMLTARSEMARKLEGLGAGADDYIVKPFNSRELLARVDSLLGKYRYEKELAERNRRMEEEYEVARLLQMRLLPDSMIEVSGYRVHGLYVPMEKVGGDFYDYRYRERTGEIELTIADVSGHGMPGAFLATVTKMALEGIDERTDTVRALNLLNDVVLRSTVKGNFVTMFFCRIDTRTNLVRYSSAGHVAPILCRRRTGEVTELFARGRPLGWLRDLALEPREAVIEPGDRLILYTDGIIECADADGELFGEERFRAFIAAHNDLLPGDFSSALLGHLKEFSGGGPFYDDISMIVFDVL